MARLVYIRPPIAHEVRAAARNCVWDRIDIEIYDTVSDQIELLYDITRDSLDEALIKSDKSTV